MYFIWKFDCKGRKDVPPDQATINNENLVFSKRGIKANARATDAGSSVSSPKQQRSFPATLRPCRSNQSTVWDLSWAQRNAWPLLYLAGREQRLRTEWKVSTNGYEELHLNYPPIGAPRAHEFSKALLARRLQKIQKY